MIFSPASNSQFQIRVSKTAAKEHPKQREVSFERHLSGDLAKLSPIGLLGLKYTNPLKERQQLSRTGHVRQRQLEWCSKNKIWVGDKCKKANSESRMLPNLAIHAPKLSQAMRILDEAQQSLHSMRKDDHVARRCDHWKFQDTTSLRAFDRTPWRARLDLPLK
nr:hypothetical protein Iba_chr02bCG4510 [Ipomoea batatas]